MAREVTVSDAGGDQVCERCEVADTFVSRLRGLQGRRSLAPGGGLLLRPSSSIHTFLMRFAIDVVFLDEDLCVVALHERLRPWRLAVGRGASAALELPAGTGRRAGIAVGQRLVLGEPA